MHLTIAVLSAFFPVVSDQSLSTSHLMETSVYTHFNILH